MKKKLHGADIVIDSLKKHGINLVFGIPGAKIDYLFEGLDGQEMIGNLLGISWPLMPLN
ncbi:hypothetical protein LTY22_05815 [Limosilactobacillus agrestis]|nr:thiamine pyrophosphate-binding protein [Limosilactobacillus agrestis]MCD7113048.1 hypothetical protein [Limosilactobacillus agrestis]